MYVKKNAGSSSYMTICYLIMMHEQSGFEGVIQKSVIDKDLLYITARKMIEIAKT